MKRPDILQMQAQSCVVEADQNTTVNSYEQIDREIEILDDCHYTRLLAVFILSCYTIKLTLFISK